LAAWFIKFRLPSNFVEFRLLLEFLEFYFGLPDFAGAIYLKFAVKFKDARRL